MYYAGEGMSGEGDMSRRQNANLSMGSLPNGREKGIRRG